MIVEPERIIAGSAGQDVVAAATGQNVICRVADKHVIVVGPRRILDAGQVGDDLVVLELSRSCKPESRECIMTVAYSLAGGRQGTRRIE